MVLLRGFLVLVVFFLLGEALREGEDWQMDDEQCSEVDREFIQFYQCV